MPQLTVLFDRLSVLSTKPPKGNPMQDKDTGIGIDLPAAPDVDDWRWNALLKILKEMAADLAEVKKELFVARMEGR
jgi:hypothetical protein